MLPFVAPIFLGAFLLFQVQPLIARCILPWFGGTPSVWTTCMLFFQVLLLVGYALSHLLASRLSGRNQAVALTLLLGLSACALAVTALRWGTPLLPDASWKPPDSSLPVLRILAILAASVGLPYTVLSTTSPLLQSWFARCRVQASPYRLYAVSNAGSLLALLSYPFLIEPALGLRHQAIAWGTLYILYSLSYAACAMRLLQAPNAASASWQAASVGAEPAVLPSAAVRALWVALPALASVMLLAATNQMCQEVAVIPFLWVVPLSLYLLSFIICFDHERWYQRPLFVVLLMGGVVLALMMVPRTENLSLKLQIGGYCLVLFLCCMVCHGELAALKPAPRYLTGFYLGIAAGGALGGVLVALVAPVVFSGYWELQLGLLLCWITAVGVGLRYRKQWPLLVQCLVVGAAVASLGGIVGPGLDSLRGHSGDLLRARNFYGVLRVTEDEPTDPLKHRHTLLHGRTIHGYQFTSPLRSQLPTSYFGVDSGIGLAILNHPRRQLGQPLRIGIIGLGTGTLATYGRPGDFIRFYDINPAVRHIALESGLFTYVAHSPAQVEVVMGDGRISLERELAAGRNEYDVFALDAFSSDSIPAHLLTREAFELYLAHLRDGNAIVAVHVSNRALDLRPVVWEAARHFGLACALISSTGKESLTYHADWMLLTYNQAFLRLPAIASATSAMDDLPEVGLWTDDYHNLFRILK